MPGRAPPGSASAPPWTPCAWPWPPLPQTLPVGANRAKWCGRFLMRLSRMNQGRFSCGQSKTPLRIQTSRSERRMHSPAAAVPPSTRSLAVWPCTKCSHPRCQESPRKWLFILGSEAISGCEVVVSEIYKLLLTSKNAAFVILPSGACRRIGTRDMLPKNTVWRIFMFGS